MGVQGFIFLGFSSILAIILASFFCVFAKCRNLQIYCTGQQISRFLAYLCIHFCIIFASFFMFFLEPFLDRLFRDFMLTFNQKVRFWTPPWPPPRVQNRPLGQPFRLKNRLLSYPADDPTVQGAIERSPQSTSGSVCSVFLFFIESDAKFDQK